MAIVTRKWGYKSTHVGTTTKEVEIKNIGNIPMWVNDIRIEVNEHKKVRFTSDVSELYFTGSGNIDFIMYQPTMSTLPEIPEIPEVPEVGDTYAIIPANVDTAPTYKTFDADLQWRDMPVITPMERSEYYKDYYQELSTLWFNDRYNKNYTLKAKDLYSYNFDIIEGDSELSKFSVGTIGRRKRPVDDKDVKQLYPTTISDVLVYYDEADLEYSTNPASAIKIEDPALFRTYPTVGNVYKDAFSTIKDNLFAHTSYNEQVTITSLPVYTLEPNRRCYIEFPKAAIYGYFLVKKVSFNLDQNGLMNATMIKLNRRDQ